MGTCQKRATYVGMEGCPVFNASTLVGLLEYTAIGEIVLGVILIFFGAWFLNFAIIFISFGVNTFVCFLILYNTGIIKDPRYSEDGGSLWAAIGLVLLCVIVGILGAILLFKMIKDISFY